MMSKDSTSGRFGRFDLWGRLFLTEFPGPIDHDLWIIDFNLVKHRPDIIIIILLIVRIRQFDQTKFLAVRFYCNEIPVLTLTAFFVFVINLHDIVILSETACSLYEDVL